MHSEHHPDDVLCAVERILKLVHQRQYIVCTHYHLSPFVAYVVMALKRNAQPPTQSDPIP